MRPTKTNIIPKPQRQVLDQRELHSSLSGAQTDNRGQVKTSRRAVRLEGGLEAEQQGGEVRGDRVGHGEDARLPLRPAEREPAAAAAAAGREGCAAAGYCRVCPRDCWAGGRRAGEMRRREEVTVIVQEVQGERLLRRGKNRLVMYARINGGFSR